jgi:CMP-N,N'-diacetyllegionaminic acid synthase
MKVLAIIPARGNSKGIPGKNLALCAGRPLIEWTLEAASQSRLITNTILSTDSYAIMEHAFPDTWIDSCRAISDEAQIEDRLDASINYIGRDHEIIVLLQPTSPVRTGKQIDEAIEQLQREGADSLLSVVESHAFLWTEIADVSDGRERLERHGLGTLWQNAQASYDHYHRPRRQDLPPQYEETGNIYVFTREHWERTHNRLGGKISIYCMPRETGYQIDDEFDLWLVEQILERQLVRSDR